MSDAEIEDLHKRRNDPGEWDDEPAAVQVRPTTTEVVSFRLVPDELDRLQAAVQERGESLSQFIRDSIQMRLRGTDFAVVEDITAAARAIFLYAGPRGSGSRVSSSGVPDYPPISQNLTSSEGVRADDQQSRLPIA